MSNAAPPGWYPDPWQQAAQRFWDGAQWTHRVSGGGAPVDRPPLPEGTPVYGPIIWILALLPILGGVLVWLVHLDTAQFVEIVRQAQQSAESGQSGYTPVTVDPFTLYGPGYFWTVGLGWASYAASVLLAYFDRRRLLRLGVVRPFHWAWAFLTEPVYVIGRSVIVRRVARPRGLAPIWVLIAAYAVALVSSTIWAVVFFSGLVHQLGQVLPPP